MMMYLDFLGDGLFKHLAAQFPDQILDQGLCSMCELEAAVRLNPKSAANHREFGRRLLQDAKVDWAQEVLALALRLDPDDTLAQFLMACALEAKGMTQTAMEELHGCLERHLEFAPAMAALDWCSQKLGDEVAISDSHLEAREVVAVG